MITNFGTHSPRCVDFKLSSFWPQESPSKEDRSDLDIISAADFGLVNGIAEWGNVFGLIGVISICSDHEVSSCGLSNRSTSTVRDRCSKGIVNVSKGSVCNHDNSERSESLKPIEPSSSEENVKSSTDFGFDDERILQKFTHDSYRIPLIISCISRSFIDAGDTCNQLI